MNQSEFTHFKNTVVAMRGQVFNFDITTDAKKNNEQSRYGLTLTEVTDDTLRFGKTTLVKMKEVVSITRESDHLFIIKTKTWSAVFSIGKD